MVPRPSPSAEGDFARTPFAHVLLYLRERRLSGTLAVQCGPAVPQLAGETLLSFEQGALAQAKLPQRLDPLGELLLEQGAITAAHLQESVARLAAGEGLQGEILQAMGVCDPRAIERGLRAQLRRKALRLFAVREATYCYFADVDLLAGFGGTPRVREDVLPIVWWGVSLHSDDRALDAVLARVGASGLRLRPDAELARFEFDPVDEALLEPLRGEAVPIERLLLAADDPRRARALLYTLLIAKQLDLSPLAPSTGTPRPTTAPRPSIPAPVGSGPSAAPTPATASPEEQARLAAAEERLAAMADETYFQMLGVPDTASVDEVQAAFLALAARFHPDRVTSPAPTLREVHQRIFSLLNEAQSTLCDATARERYLATVRDGGGTPNAQRKIAALIEAGTDVQKAEICLRRREFAEAERLARRALAVHAEDAHTLAVLAQVLVERQAEGAVDEAISLLRRAVELTPQHDRGHTLLGQLYKQRGDGDRALEHFRLAAAANPRNVDATREVRLAEMRARGTSPAPNAPGGGLLARLFKR